MERKQKNDRIKKKVEFFLEKIRNRKRFVFFVLLNLVLFVLLFSVGITDETKDDMSIQLYITGHDGISNYYHMWASVPRMLITFLLQKICPIFAWNYLLEVIFIFISINIICNEILRKTETDGGMILALFIAILLFFQTISKLNFTRTAAIMMCAGICLFFHEKERTRLYGGIWFLLGSLYRFKLVCLSIGFLPILLLWKYVQQKEEKTIFQMIKEYVVPLILLLILTVGLETAGLSFINSIPEWKKLRDRNVLSEHLLDYGLKSYRDNQEEYKQWEISENDRDMVLSRMSNSDSDFFTNEKYQMIIDTFSERWSVDFSKEYIKNCILENKKYLQNSLFGGCILAIMTALFICSRRKQKLTVLLSFMCLLSYLGFFYIMGRVVERISFGIYLWAGVTLLICFKKDEIIEKCRIKVMNIPQSKLWKKGMLVAVLICTISMSIKYQRHADMEIAEIYDYMTDNKEYFYFYTKISEAKAVKNLLFMEDYWDTGNCFYSSEFDVSPNDRFKMEQYGIDNIYKDSVNSNVIRIVDNRDIKQIEKYIREHYCDNARAVLIDTVGKYRVYQIVAV